MIKNYQKHPLWFAAFLHRLSGIGLALFLPVHFYVLGLALAGPGSLDRFLHWSEQPLVKMAEFGLVFLLAVHAFGGLRLLALEFLPWRPYQKTFASTAAAAAFLVACSFLLGGV